MPLTIIDHNSNFTCRRCGFITFNQKNFMRHLTKKTPCEALKEDIPIETLIQEHRRHNRNIWINPETQEKVFMCGYCGKGFPSAKNRLRHETPCGVGGKVYRTYDRPATFMTSHDERVLREEAKEEVRPEVSVEVEQRLRRVVREEERAAVRQEVWADAYSHGNKDGREQALVALHADAYAQIHQRISSDLRSLQRLIIQKFKNTDRRALIVRDITGILDKLNMNTTPSAHQEPPSEASASETIPATIQNEDDNTVREGSDIETHIHGNVNDSNTYTGSTDNHVETNDHSTNNTTNYNMHLPAITIPPPPVIVPLHAYNAPDMPKAKMQEVIEKYAQTRHRATFIRNATRALYCFRRDNNSILYTRFSHDGYVYKGAAIGVCYMKGPDIVAAVVASIRTCVDALDTIGVIPERVSEELMKAIDTHSIEVHARDIAPVLHDSSHDMFGNILETWKERYPDYVERLHRNENEYLRMRRVPVIPGDDSCAASC